MTTSLLEVLGKGQAAGVQPWGRVEARGLAYRVVRPGGKWDVQMAWADHALDVQWH